MGHLVPILLALASLALEDFDATTGWRVPYLVPALALVPYALAKARRRAGLRGNFRRAAWLENLGTLVPVFAQYLAISLFGWQGTLEGWFDVRLSILEWPHPGLLLALAPFVLYTLASIDADARVNQGHHGLHRNLRRFQLRMFLAGLAPIVTYLVLAALVGRSDYLRIHVEEVALLGAGFTALTLLVFVFFLPFLLQHTWDTEPLTRGPERALLEGVAELARFRCKQMLVWRTGGLMANAAIVGVTPGSRRVFFSDALLRRLGPRELASVYAHEIGHARRHHVPLFIACAIAFFAGLDLLALELDPEGGSTAAVVLAVGLALWLVGFGWLSRRIELEADLYSLELLGDSAGLVSALSSVASGRSSKAGWRHFSTAQRVAFLQGAENDPAVGRSLRGKLGRARWVAGLALVATLSLQLLRFADSYPEDMALASLRLGRYKTAAARLQEAQEPSDELAELVRLARTTFEADFDDRASAAHACRARALALEPGGEVELIEPWWVLAALAGDEGARERGQ